jgi:hypothetical protein
MAIMKGARKASILRTLCQSIVKVLFPSRYPGPGIFNEEGARVHQAMHERVVKEIVKALDGAIEQLDVEELEGAIG